MAHWAQLDDNNVILQITVGDNNDPDEGYQWLVNNIGGRWLKTSFNTFQGQHLNGGTPLRGNYASVGGKYYPEIDAFMPPSPYPSWVIDTNDYTWTAPVPLPDSGMWKWDETTVSWIENEDH